MQRVRDSTRRRGGLLMGLPNIPRTAPAATALDVLRSPAPQKVHAPILALGLGR